MTRRRSVPRVSHAAGRSLTLRSRRRGRNERFPAQKYAGIPNVFNIPKILIDARFLASAKNEFVQFPSRRGDARTRIEETVARMRLSKVTGANGRRKERRREEGCKYTANYTRVGLTLVRRIITFIIRSRLGGVIMFNEAAVRFNNIIYHVRRITWKI